MFKEIRPPRRQASSSAAESPAGKHIRMPEAVAVGGLFVLVVLIGLFCKMNLAKLNSAPPLMKTLFHSSIQP